jgi:hypothetical protein
MQSLAVVSLRYPVHPNPEAWVIPEGPVPESTAHQLAVYRIYCLLLSWSRRMQGARSIRIGQELAVRWLEQHPRTGIDPDVCVLDPAPTDFDDLTSLRLWEPGRVPPRLAIEVVSASHPYKDYVAIQERYAAMGVEELLVFDPLLQGPRSLGGPVALQMWRRDATLSFERVHFGDEPVHSLVLDAWCIPDGRNLHIADDRSGTALWPTDSDLLKAAEAVAARAVAETTVAKMEARQAKQEAERAEAEAERATAEAERATAEAERASAEAERATAEAERERQAREELERRLRELEAKLPR